MDDAFEAGFSAADWSHTLGGTHVFLSDDGAIVSHAAVVERLLMANDAPLRTGYVEGVATDRDRRRRGYSTIVMRRVNKIIASTFELGALSTDVPDLYLKLGWEPWQGPTYVAMPEGPFRTGDEDAGIMVLRTAATAEIDLASSLTCEAREGDSW